MMRWLVAPLLLLSLFLGMATGTAKQITIPDIEIIIERVANISGLPVASPPKEIQEVPISAIVKLTRKPASKALYICWYGRRGVMYYAPSYGYLVPHELTHMLQCAARVNPTSSDSERQAVRVQQIYYQMWPMTWLN